MEGRAGRRGNLAAGRDDDAAVPCGYTPRLARREVSRSVMYHRVPTSRPTVPPR